MPPTTRSRQDGHLPPSETHPTRLSRRGFLLAGLVAVQAVAVAGTTRSERSRTFYREFNRFTPLNDPDFYELVATYAETPVPLIEGEPDADGRRTFRFSLARDTTVFLAAAAESSEPIFVHPLIVRVDDGPRLLLPLIRSANPDRGISSPIQLGMLEAGDHTFTLEQDAAATFPLPESLVLSATRPEPDALLAKLMAHVPVIEIKNPENVLDDIPLMAFAKLYRREDQYKITTFVIFSSENGGTMPARLLDVYQRTVDIEWVTQQIYSFDGEPVSDRLSFQTIRHGFAQFDGPRVLGEHPLLSIASENNNFSDGKVRVLGWAIPRLSVPYGSDPILYAPKPRFLPGSDWGASLMRDYPELQRWSLFELTMEGCMVDNGRIDPDEDQFFADLAVIQDHLTVSFPNRGCRTQLTVVRERDQYGIRMNGGAFSDNPTHPAFSPVQ